MSPEDRRELAMIPAAHALVAAVADRDATKVRDVLASEIDYPALVVLLADMASRAPAATYIRSIIDDIRLGRDRDVALGNRYGLSPNTIRNLRRDNARPVDDTESPGVLDDGEWVIRNGVQVWRPSKEVA